MARVGSGRGHVTEIDLAQALPWLLQRRASALETERTRYFRLQSDKIAQELRVRAGELVEASEVEHRWAGMVAAARERLLALPPLVLQRRLVPAEHEDALIGLVNDALADLASRVHA